MEIEASIFSILVGKFGICGIFGICSVDEVDPGLDDNINCGLSFGLLFLSFSLESEFIFGISGRLIVGIVGTELIFCICGRDGILLFDPIPGNDGTDGIEEFCELFGKVN